MKSAIKGVMLAVLAATSATAVSSSVAAQEIPRAASTPDTPKNWVAPKFKNNAQALVDKL